MRCAIFGCWRKRRRARLSLSSPAIDRTGEEVTALRRALLRVNAQAASSPAFKALRLSRISPVQPDAYDILLRYEAEAAALNYAVLA